jgi:hypothetical protein
MQLHKSDFMYSQLFHLHILVVKIVIDSSKNKTVVDLN